MNDFFSLWHIFQINLSLNLSLSFIWLTHFQPMFRFYNSWKHQKTGGLLMFSGGIKVEHWLKMG